MIYVHKESEYEYYNEMEYINKFSNLFTKIKSMEGTF